MKILFLVPYPLGKSPSQRFRFEQYFSLLDRSNIEWHAQSFWDSSTWNVLYNRGYILLKVVGILKGHAKRLFILFRLSSFDFIFIHRECTPIGPPVVEWIIAKILRKKIIYDFDDAIWLTDRSGESFWISLIRWRSKVKSICLWSYRVSCGNSYLCSFASQFNSQVVYNPTTIDTDSIPAVNVQVLENNARKITIGWTGSHSTLKYIEGIEDILKDIEQSFPDVNLVVIADRPPKLKLRSLVFKPWNLINEIDDLREIDIGIMPLPDDEWSKGKCGFKALQYMALGIPTVASPVGVNPLIIDHGINGFLGSTPEEWKNYIRLLITDTQLRERLGKKGIEKIADQYSVRSNKDNFLSLFAWS